MKHEAVRVFRVGQRGSTKTTQTPGIERQEVFSNPSVWVGTVRTAPGTVSGWHHHGDNDTYIYVIAGKGRLDFGASGQGSVEGGPGDILMVPKGLVHREANPGTDELVVFLVRVGGGPPVFNVDGPAV